MQSHRELQGTDHNSGIFSREFIKPPADTHRGKSLLLVQTDRPLIRHAHFKDNAGNLVVCGTFFISVSSPSPIPRLRHAGFTATFVISPSSAARYIPMYPCMTPDSSATRKIVSGRQSESKKHSHSTAAKNLRLQRRHLRRIFRCHAPDNTHTFSFPFAASCSLRSLSAWDSRRYSGRCSAALSVFPSL